MNLTSTYHAAKTTISIHNKNKKKIVSRFNHGGKKLWAYTSQHAWNPFNSLQNYKWVANTIISRQLIITSYAYRKLSSREKCMTQTIFLMHFSIPWHMHYAEFNCGRANKAEQHTRQKKWQLLYSKVSRCNGIFWERGQGV